MGGIANPAEQTLWAMLKGRQLGGWEFTRQYPVGPYLADFACREKFFIIEVDSSRHDRKRDEYMIRAGYAVFRVPSLSVLHERNAVCESILAVLEERIEDFVEARRTIPPRSRGGGRCIATGVGFSKKCANLL